MIRRALAAYAVTPLGVMLIAGGLIGCGSTDEEPTPETETATCAEGKTIGDACVGVPDGPVCASSSCTEGVTCKETFEVANDKEYSSAADRAGSGSCIVLLPGSFGRLVVPGGVSLLGKGAADVRAVAVELDAGDGATVRGLAVESGSVVVASGSNDVHIDQVLVENSEGSGVEVGSGSHVTISKSEIVGSALYGVSAFDAGSLDVAESIISGSMGPGLWAQCATGCDCASPMPVSVTSTMVRDNKIVGVSLVGAAAVLQGVDISDHAEGADFRPGGGMSVSGCSDISASGTRVADNSSYGILVDTSSGSLGGSEEADGVEVTGNYTGIWVNGADGLHLEGLTLDNNHGVALGLAGDSRGIVCWRSVIRDTQSTVVPVLSMGAASSDEVGDGMSWLDGSQVEIDGLTFENNARSAMLIDGPAGSGSTIANVELTGGDEALGLVQQNAPDGTDSPTVGSGAPSIEQSTGELFSVPVGPSAPSSI